MHSPSAEHRLTQHALIRPTFPFDPRVFPTVKLGSLSTPTVWQIMDCLVDRQHLLSGPSMTPQTFDSSDKGGLVECVLGRSLAHPHLVPSYDYGVSTLEVGCLGG